jgi:hypothetical protein
MKVTVILIIGLLSCMGCNMRRVGQEKEPQGSLITDPKGRSDTSRIAKVKIDRGGKIFLNDVPVSLEELKRNFSSLREAKGEVWYYRENPEADPSPESWVTAKSVIEAVAEAKLPIKLSSRPDFSDAVDSEGRVIPPH